MYCALKKILKQYNYEYDNLNFEPTVPPEKAN